jgi:hypothetical protein
VPTQPVKFTSKAIINEILNEPESRKDWMLGYFRSPGEINHINLKLWQEGNHPEEINSNRFFIEKLEYIHNNPVEDLVVERPEDYFFSSARNYAGLSNPLDVARETILWQTYK